MPEIITESTPTTPVTEGPRDADRAALYEKHYGSTAATTEAQPVTESTAQVEHPQVPVAPPVAQLPPEVLQLLQSMRDELAEVKSKIAQPVAPAVETPTPELAWITLMREGKVEEATNALAEFVAKKNSQQTIDQAVAQSREYSRAESTVAAHVTAVRAANPDMLALEPMISYDVTQRIAKANNAGLVKTTDDAIRVYIQSVNEAVSEARKLYQSIRGDGKQEAMTRNREVLSSRPVTPLGVNSERPQVTGETAEPVAQTDADYIKNRQTAAARLKGLSNF